MTRLQNDALRRLIEEAVTEINAHVPSDAELLRYWHTRHAKGLTEEERLLHADPREAKSRRSYWRDERSRFAVLFRLLARNQPLPTAELRELLGIVRQGVTLTLRTEVVNGRPVLHIGPVFATDLAKLCYA